MARAKKKNKKKRGDLIKLVVKSNELVEARYMFDIWESRFFQFLSTMIRKDDDDDKVYRVWFRDVKKTFGLKSNQSYSLLREAAKSIAGKSVYIGWMNDEFRRGRLHRVIRFVDYLEEGQKGRGIEQQEYIDVSIDKDIKPFLLYVQKNFDPKETRYTSYDVRNTAKLMPYGMRIYELLKQFEYKGFRTIRVEDLKNMFLIENEYPRFSNFYQKVIKKSIDDINKYSDITIPEEHIKKIKEGRRVTALRFKIESKTIDEVAAIRGEAIQQSLFDVQKTEVIEPEEIEETKADNLYTEFEDVVIKKFGVTPSAFLKMLNSGKYEKEHIEQAIAVTRRAKYNQEIKKSISGFFLSALKNGYTDAKEEARKAQKRTGKNKQKVKELESELNILEDKLAQAIKDKIRKLTVEKPEITSQSIELLQKNQFHKAYVLKKEHALGKTLTVEDYREDKTLRAIVINNIIKLENAFFEDIFSHYNPRILALKNEIERLSV